jgi:hypothetical protein
MLEPDVRICVLLPDARSKYSFLSLIAHIAVYKIHLPFPSHVDICCRDGAVPVLYLGLAWIHNLLVVSGIPQPEALLMISVLLFSAVKNSIGLIDLWYFAGV